MIIGVLDLETSGKARQDLPFTAPQQPHIASFTLATFDTQLRKMRHAFKSVLRSDGWMMEEEASVKNGISDGMLEAYGVDAKWALEVVNKLMSSCDMVLIYNRAFDLFIMQAECYRHNVPCVITPANTHCVMIPYVDICRLPPTRPWQKDFKWPKLSEAYMRVFQEPLIDNHEDLADVMATWRLACWLVDNEKVQWWTNP